MVYAESYCRNEMKNRSKSKKMNGHTFVAARDVYCISCQDPITSVRWGDRAGKTKQATCWLLLSLLRLDVGAIRNIF